MPSCIDVVSTFAQQTAILPIPFTVTPEVLLTEAIAQFQDSDLYLIVVEDHRPIGIFTATDLTRLLNQSTTWESIKIREVMTEPVLTLKLSEFKEISTLIEFLKQHQLHHLPVVDEHGKLIGLVSDRSLQKTQNLINLLELQTLQELITSPWVQAPPTTSLLELAQQMAVEQVKCVVLVVENSVNGESFQSPVGVITQRDLLQFQMLGLDWNLPASQVMSTPVFCLKSHDSLLSALNRMQQSRIQQIPMLGEQGELQGMITFSQILNVINSLECNPQVQSITPKQSSFKSSFVQPQLSTVPFLALQPSIQSKPVQNLTAVGESKKVKAKVSQVNQELEQILLERTTKLEREERKSRLFAEISLKIGQFLDLNQILQTMVEEVQKILQCDRLLIYQISDDGTGKVIAESVVPSFTSILNLGFPEEVFPLQHQRLYRQDQVKAIADVIQSYQTQTPCLCDFLEQFQVKAKLVVPIITPKELWGFIIAHHCESPREWTEFETELLREVTAQVSIAVEQAELVQTIQDREQFIENIADSSPNILYIFDLVEFRFHYVSKASIEIINYTPEDLIQMGDKIIETIIDPDDQSAMIEHLNHYILDRMAPEGSYLEYRVLNQQGECRWLASHDRVFKRNAAGKPRQIIGVAQNISDRKAAELAKQIALKEVEFQKFALDQAAIVAITNQQGIITYVNDTFCTVSQYFREEILGRTHKFLNSGYHSSTFFKEMWSTIKSGKVWKGEIKNKKKNGEFYWVDTTIVPFLDEQNKPFQYLAIRMDITERKEAEHQLQTTNAQLAAVNLQLSHASRLKDEFLATMSHELRTPLNAILAMSDVMQNETFGALNEQQHQALGIIYRNGKHLLELINDILDLSKIEAGDLELERSPVSVPELCEHCLNCVKKLATQKNIQLSFHIEAVTEAVEVDERRIRQVLINLLNNAVKFTPENGQIRLEVRGNQLEQKISFSVIDTGIGISVENQTKLFKVFRQVDSRLSRRYGGTGLGLILVKKLVELHGGTVNVESQEGKGSCFTVTLPWLSLNWEEFPPPSLYSATHYS